MKNKPIAVIGTFTKDYNKAINLAEQKSTGGSYITALT